MCNTWDKKLKKTKKYNETYLFSLNDIITNNLNNPKIMKIKKKKKKEIGVLK